MMKRNNFFKGIRGLQSLKAVPLALLLLQGKQAFAEETAQAAQKLSEGTSALEILGYVAMIVGVILLAWVLVSWQSKGNNRPDVPHKVHKHFDHPNDPHFRKLKKKTS